VVSSGALTVEQYLSELEPSRSEEVSILRGLCLEHLPVGLEEQMNWGMISYQVPLSTLPNTYNSQPLLFAAIAAQKHHISLYLMALYAFENQKTEFESSWLGAGFKLDAGKACIRFRTLALAPLDLIEKVLGAISVEDYVVRYLEMQNSKRKQQK